MDIVSGELGQYLVPVHLCSLFIGGVGNLQPDMPVLGHASETVLYIVLYGVYHNGLTLVGCAGLGKGVQLFSLDLQYRL